jgi:hypothetical protein
MKMTLLLRVLFVVVCLLGITAIPSFARTDAAPLAGGGQTHPCEEPELAQQTVTTGATHKARFCLLVADNPEAITVYVNNVPSDLRPLTRVTATTSASGKALYEGPVELAFVVGTHTVQVSAWNRMFAGGTSQEGAKSGPLALSAVVGAAPPAAPTGLRIVR